MKTKKQIISRMLHMHEEKESNKLQNTKNEAVNKQKTINA